MPFARIWYEPGGSVKITYFIDGADPGYVAGILHKDGHVDKNATFDDVETEVELRSLIPADRTERYKWRKRPGQRGVRVDPTIPDTPRP